MALSWALSASLSNLHVHCTYRSHTIASTALSHVPTTPQVEGGEKEAKASSATTDLWQSRWWVLYVVIWFLSVSIKPVSYTCSPLNSTLSCHMQWMTGFQTAGSFPFAGKSTDPCVAFLIDAWTLNTRYIKCVENGNVWKMLSCSKPCPFLFFVR